MGVRGNRPLPVETFAGWDPTTDSTQVGWAAGVDARNVDFDTPDLVRTRDGATLITAGLSTVDTYAYSTVNYAGSENLVALGYNAGSVFLDVGGMPGLVFSSPGSWAAAGKAGASIAHIGTATQTLSFFTSTATLRKYDGGVLSASVGSPYYVAVTPVSNRLVQARFAAAAGSPTGANGTDSTVFFSDAGAPETFSANNYVHLHPGDGESIRGVVVWRDLLFVFKRTRCFVFYGESTDSAGQPVFNYRTVTHPRLLDAVDESLPVVGVGANGVYLLAADGVYVSTGGEFVKVSRPVDGVLGDLDADNDLVYGLSCAARRVLVTVLAAGGTTTSYVLDETTGVWSPWVFASTPPHPFIDWPAVFPYGRGLVFAGFASNKLYRTDPAATTDDGTAFAAWYQSGWNAAGGPGVEVTVRETELTGTGAPLFSWARDFGSFDTPVAVALGTSPAVARGYHRVAKAGENLSFKMSSTSGAWSVRRVVPFVRDVRGPGEKTS